MFELEEFFSLGHIGEVYVGEIRLLEPLLMPRKKKKSATIASQNVGLFDIDVPRNARGA